MDKAGGGEWGGRLWPQGPHPPQGLSDHVFICDPIVSEGLIPCGVQSVSESFCSELIGLERVKNDPGASRSTVSRIMAPKDGHALIALNVRIWQRGIEVVNQLTLKQGDYLDLGGPYAITGSLKAEGGGRQER